MAFSFLLSSLVALIYRVFTISINNGIFGLTFVISSAITLSWNLWNWWNQRIAKNQYRLESVKQVEVIPNNQTVVETVAETIVHRTISTNGGNYGENIGQDFVAGNKSIKNITVGNREVEIKPNNIVETFDELRDILAQSIAQSSDALEAISGFAKQLTEELRNRPEVKVCFDIDGNANEQEIIKKIFVDLLTLSYDKISEINRNNLIVKPGQIQQLNIPNNAEFIESFKYCGNNEYDVLYKIYAIHLFQDGSKWWHYKIRRSNLSILERNNRHRSANIYFAIGRAINEIEKELKTNWFNNLE
ncbi:hypothetical protein [Dulcicalothrix desertica]|uniref:hypothetical protein n=1 Tax=Dulcicalothrix desertica TaxID=32056 RepID=UPI000F8F68A5|nr:hypothetical protein [Dulcicalothrix desertica]